MLAGLLVGLLVAAGAAAQGFADPKVARAQAQIDAGDPEGALETLANAIDKRRPNAEALLVRSTALVMTGDLAGGNRDLRRAVEVDPTLRQAWLNLAGLEIAEADYPAAEKALLAAQKLDPAATDSDLNLGVVALLQQRGDEAAERFDHYLAREKDVGEAQFLVAANYALVGDEARAVDHLRRSIAAEERNRLRARRDERFASLASPPYLALLETDGYQPPAGSLASAAAFRLPYERQDPKLLYAVLDSLKSLKIPFEPNVEAVDGWALVWVGTMRVKVSNQSDGTGVVQLTAPAGAFTPDEWQRRSQELYRAIETLVRHGDDPRPRPRRTP